VMTESGCSVARLQTFNSSCFFTSEMATCDQDGAVRAAPPSPSPPLPHPQYHCANLYHLHSRFLTRVCWAQLLVRQRPRHRLPLQWHRGVVGMLHFACQTVSLTPFLQVRVRAC
jgi:hypothetical protein